MANIPTVLRWRPRKPLNREAPFLMVSDVAMKSNSLSSIRIDASPWETTIGIDRLTSVRQLRGKIEHDYILCNTKDLHFLKSPVKCPID
jgi:hypothetical protein